MSAEIRRESVIGVFIGLESSTYEYIADIIAPYQLDFSIDIGSFLLIESGPEVLVSRVMQYVPRGEFTSFMGEKWLSEVALEGDAIGSDIKKRKISYRVRIKILGALSDKGEFKPGLMRIPHITSRVFKPDVEQTKQIVNKALEEQRKGIEVGTYVLDDSVKVNFDMTKLNAKRTFIFSRAGYGKSNLMKIIASEWKQEYGGLLIFDPEGEYAVTNVNKGPGIMDKREAVWITNRSVETSNVNVYSKLKLDLRQFSAGQIIPILVAEAKHDSVFFPKLMTLGGDRERWARLVNVLYRDGFLAANGEIEDILQLEPNDAQIGPIKNNLVPKIRSLHEPDSNLLEIIGHCLKDGRVVIVDVSLIDSKSALWLSSIIVRHFFNLNQANFTSAGEESLVKATFVVEEAQTVLTGSDVGSFIELAKEGRKYYLGGIFVTQQPSAIPFEILSQADNFFVFHLLSRGDLESLNRANAHYSNDIITQILNEPIRGKCYMWTSHQPFVVPMMVKKFDAPYVKSNQSQEIQSKSNLLGPILKEVIEESKDPQFKSILDKLVEVDTRLADHKVGDRTKELFKRLSEEEKEFLRKRDGLQANIEGVEFAVKTGYYLKLKGEYVSRQVDMAE
jgi:DNA helicase HerA-like ATPase